MVKVAESIMGSAKYDKSYGGYIKSIQINDAGDYIASVSYPAKDNDLIVNLGSNPTVKAGDPVKITFPQNDPHNPYIQSVSGSFVGGNGSQWNEVNNEKIEKLKNTVDFSKKNIFTEKPNVPYNRGDIWIDSVTGKMFYCINTRHVGDYNDGDWDYASKYMEDDYLSEAFMDFIKDGGIGEQIDGKSEIWTGTSKPLPNTSYTGQEGYYDSSNINYPAENWYTQTLKNAHTNDLYIYKNTATGDCYFYKWNGAYWERAKDMDITSLEGQFTSYAEAVTKNISDIQGQVDGKIDTWFYAVAPTLSNPPANQWTTNDMKDSHIDDLYYNTATGKTYVFNKSGSTYSWKELQDEDIEIALSAASSAQDTADNKRRVFTAQPVPPYDVGDIWVQGSTGDIKYCKTARASGSYAAADWALASKYTDDTKANEAASAAASASSAANAAASAAAAKTKVWYSQPSTPYTVGDIYVTSSNIYRCKTARSTGSYTASDWEVVQSSIDLQGAKNNAADIFGALTYANVMDKLSGGNQGVYKDSTTGEYYINANYIKAGVIDGTLIKSHTITSEMIVTSGLTADLIKTGTLDCDNLIVKGLSGSGSNLLSNTNFIKKNESGALVTDPFSRQSNVTLSVVQPSVAPELGGAQLKNNALRAVISTSVNNAYICLIDSNDGVYNTKINDGNNAQFVFSFWLYVDASNSMSKLRVPYWVVVNKSGSTTGASDGYTNETYVDGVKYANQGTGTFTSGWHRVVSVFTGKWPSDGRLLLGMQATTNKALNLLIYRPMLCSGDTPSEEWSLSEDEVSKLQNTVNGWSFTNANGETLINGNAITTGMIKSVDGKTYFDLDESQIRTEKNDPVRYFNGYEKNTLNTTVFSAGGIHAFTPSDSVPVVYNGSTTNWDIYQDTTISPSYMYISESIIAAGTFMTSIKSTSIYTNFIGGGTGSVGVGYGSTLSKDGIAVYANNGKVTDKGTYAYHHAPNAFEYVAPNTGNNMLHCNDSLGAFDKTYGRFRITLPLANSNTTSATVNYDDNAKTPMRCWWVPITYKSHTFYAIAADVLSDWTSMDDDGTYGNII